VCAARAVRARERRFHTPATPLLARRTVTSSAVTSPQGEFDDVNGDEVVPPLLPQDDRLWRHPSEFSGPSPQQLDPEAVRTRWISNEPSKASAWSAGFVGALLAAGIVLVGAHLVTVFNDAPLSGTSVLTASVTTTLPMASPNLGAQLNVAIDRIGHSLAVIDAAPVGASASQRALGVVVGSDGVVLTAASAVGSVSSVLVELPGSGVVSVAQVLCVDSESGLALIKVDGTNNLPALGFSGAEMTAPSFAVAVTSPGGLGVSPSISLGSLQSLNVRARTTAGTLMDVDTTDLNSSTDPPGTPLLGSNGQIEAIVTGSLGGKAVVTPGWLAGPISAELLAHDSVQHGWIGIAGVDAATSSNHVPGVEIQKVQAHSAAAGAGLRAGDIIVALDGQRLASMSQLQGRLYVLGAGTAVRLTIDRNGARHNLTVSLSIANAKALAATP
jgi:S1-C subfamily serine protease